MLSPSRSRFFGLFALLTGMFLASCHKKSKPVPPPPPPEPPRISYNHEIRPVLARKCFSCHGRDRGNNKSGLRLDLASFAFDPLAGESHRHALIPGDRAGSVLWLRLTTASPSAPPPSPAHDQLLTPGERDLVGRWIDQGAAYESHWAFEPLPATVPLPEVSNKSWPRNEIDRFVLAPLEHAALAPAPEASPPTLQRRLSLALTGLGPTLDALRDPDLDFEATIDRLLASPAFGEHLAAGWLESAGYADTFSADSGDLTTRWPYRDWVVDAFNNNLPYDQFLIAQLAGDHEGSGAIHQPLATAFNRLHPLRNDPGANPHHERVKHAAARVQTLGTTVLGLTLHCARCHDHKSDPLHTREFYSLTAFFNSIAENGLYFDPAIVPAPTHTLPNQAQARALFEAQNKGTKLETLLREAVVAGEPDFRAWLGREFRTPQINDAVGIFTFDDRKKVIPNQALLGSGSGQAGDLEFGEGFSGSAARFQGNTRILFSRFFPVRRWNPWTFTLRLREDQRSDSPAVLLSRGRGPVEGLRGLDLLLDDGHLVARIARDWPGNALAVRSVEPVVPPGRWTLVTWTYDGSSSAEGLRLFVDGKPVRSEILADSLWKRALPINDGAIDLQLGARPGARGFANGAIDDFQVHSRALTALEIAHLYDGNALTTALANSADRLPALRDHFFSSVYPKTRALQESLTAARRDSIVPELELLEVPVMREEADPTPTFVLDRGDPTTPPTEDRRVARALPAFLPEFTPTTPQSPTRLDLAAALNDPNHPLTARVFVNRVWALFFGPGLVDSTTNFGVLGASPSHPDLLDWLARDFVDHGWDVKHLCRTIAQSATFRQDSAARPELRERAPHRLLAQGPSFPLPPTQHRDLVLHAAGLLSIGPATLQGEAGEDSYLRSIYGLRKHSQPLPERAADLQDDAGRQLCTIDYTQAPPPPSGPILGDRDLLVASRALATRLLNEEQDETARLNALYLLLHGRLMNEQEGADLPLWVAQQRSRFDPEDRGAPQLVRPGQNPEANRLELATWTSVIRLLIGSQSSMR